MFIQTADTPNPDTMKFLPGRVLVEEGQGIDFPRREAAENCPLAINIFNIEGVEAIFIGHDFLSVTKTADWDWYVLKPLILGVIMDVLILEQPLFLEKPSSPKNTTEDSGEEDPLVVQIKDLLDTRIRPAVAMDGGDITFVRFDSGIVYLEMKGACSGCPSSSVTLKSGIENMLKHYVPEVIGVESIE